MRTRKIRHLLAASTLALGAMITAHAAAAVPAAITHQGRLYNAQNLPINGQLVVLFAIYDSANAVTPLWSEQQTVTFDDGYYHAALGSMVPFAANLFDGSVRYFGMAVGSDA